MVFRQIFAIARAGMLATQDMLSRVADPAAAANPDLRGAFSFISRRAA